jgi:hypothetical protein
MGESFFLAHFFWPNQPERYLAATLARPIPVERLVGGSERRASHVPLRADVIPRQERDFSLSSPGTPL